MDYSGLKINCLGASNTCIVKNLQNETVKGVNYPAMIGTLLGCTVRNYGKGGTNIAVCDGRCDSYFERIAVMEKDADIVILQGDGNDASHGLPLGVPGDRSPRTYIGAVHGCIARIREEFPGARIIVLTGMQKIRQPDREDGLTHADFHRAFADACRECGIEPHDFSADPELSAACSDVMPDGLHMSEKGCRHYSETVWKMIKALFEP